MNIIDDKNNSICLLQSLNNNVFDHIFLNIIQTSNMLKESIYIINFLKKQKNIMKMPLSLKWKTNE